MIFIKDEEFIRGKCPMTKEEIRILSISKMNLENDSKVLDVGSGTGSITVQCGKMCDEGLVYSIEKEDEAYDITKQNMEKFGLNNVELIKNNAKDALEKLVAENIELDSIFIGGSSGQLEDIIRTCDKLLKKNGTIVMNFITLNNAYEACEVMKTLNYNVDVSLINVSKNRGKTLMMMALNPIYVIQCIKE